MTDLPKTSPGSAVLDLLLAEFHRLDRARLTQAGGDWSSIAAQLAQAHDLTPREAAETLQDWLMRRLTDAVARAA